MESAIQPNKTEIGVKDIVFYEKKAVKISSAIKLLIGLIQGNDNIKDELSKLSVTLVLDIITAKNSLGLKRQEMSLSVLTTAEKIYALISLGFLTGLFSEMNRTVLQSELNLLINGVRSLLFVPKKEETGTFVLPAITEIPDTYIAEPNHRYDDTLSLKGDVFNDYKNTNSINRAIPSEMNSRKVADLNTANVTDLSLDRLYKKPVQQGHSVVFNDQKKDVRRKVILGLIRASGSITVADVKGAISDCSEKTLQRELISMVSEGVLRMEGRRRWSRYLLSSTPNTQTA